MKIPKPEERPEKGFYYHYKHDEDIGVDDYAYEVLGVGCHTEEDCDPEDAFMVVYRPLYSSAMVYRAGKLFDVRPLQMFLEDVTKDGKTFPRFTKITDPAIITELTKIRDEMYSF